MLWLLVSMAHVIAWQMLYALLVMWQMLLPRGRWLSSFFVVLLANVIANVMWKMFSPLQYIATIDWLVLMPSGRWNSHMLLFVIDVIWADVIAPWQMEWPLFVLFVIADVIALWQMEWPLQGVSASLLVDVVPRGQMDMGNLFKFQF